MYNFREIVARHRVTIILFAKKSERETVSGSPQILELNERSCFHCGFCGLQGKKYPEIKMPRKSAKCSFERGENFRGYFAHFFSLSRAEIEDEISNFKFTSADLSSGFGVASIKIAFSKLQKLSSECVHLRR